MIGYALVGSNDLERAKTFYDALLGAMGIGKMFDHMSGGRIYGTNLSNPFFGVVGPFNQEPATVGNGTMVSFQMDSRAEVDRIHAVALTLGAANEGAPGLRGDPSAGFYIGYFRDLDGNKLAAYHATA